MVRTLLTSLSFFWLSTTLVCGQSSIGSGYTGYNLSSFGDPLSATYSTASTPANVSVTFPEPDVYLNASVHVGLINLTVSNITAKINLDAQVLKLLQFNAGVDVSISRVSLIIEQVNANVLLEARLGNLVLMINDVLHSLDLNPIIATLGQDVGKVVNTTVGGLIGPPAGSHSKRDVPASYDLLHNILYSVNDYTGHTHTNRILAQNGSIIDESLDNNGHVYNEQIVGFYSHDMTFSGHNESMIVNKKVERELEYTYAPFPGLIVVSLIYTDADGNVLRTKVISEASGGGSSTVGNGP